MWNTTRIAFPSALLCVLMGFAPRETLADTVWIAGRRLDSETLRNIPSQSAQAAPFAAPDFVSGMDFWNDQILMVSEQAGKLYVISPDDGSVIRTVDLPSISDRDPGGYGIAATDTFWWHTDYQKRKLYRLDPSDGSVLAEFPQEEKYLGIAWTGTELWGVHPGTKLLHQIDPNNGEILQSISLGSMDGPVDLTWDGGNLWVAERDGVHFHQIDSAGNILRTESTGGDFPWGIAAANPNMWVGTTKVPPEDPKLLLFDLGLPSACTLDVVLTYTGNTLTMDFVLGPDEVVLWSTWLVAGGELVPLWSTPIPAFPPTPVSIPIADFPHIGFVGVVTTFHTGAGVICSDFDFVDTGP